MSKTRIAINGFGRIGRMFFRVAHDKENFDIVAINDVMEPYTMAHLLKYDSVHKRFQGEVKSNSDYLEVNGKKIRILKEENPVKLPWKKLNIDVVIESTGMFTKKEDALKHVEAGARKVIISAPAKGESDGVQFIVLGVNDHLIDKNDVVISNSSCTTNNAALIIKVLDDNWGIQKAFITTVHSYTRDQNILDGPHQDLRRGRAAAYSIVPTTTGAAKAATKIFPHLAKDLGGAGIRVPVPDGSLTDLTCTLSKCTSVEEINSAFKEASETTMKGLLEYTEDPIVSMDVIGNPHSAVFDAGLTAVLGEKNKLVKVIAWYDNEVGYSHRLMDLVEKFV
ncbi:MAG: type I glyceraldehyde-3-phosphate dehydrogenase [Bacteroidetes bacterium]|nr:type I glyceraldehyde-3-phosphate dehydrogenase [Bacteroidota bacterium]MBL7105109.1 type I glyceraldehyde-3-phosphate dehydrogenase [Bacteroidales bacterium]